VLPDGRGEGDGLLEIPQDPLESPLLSLL